MSDITEIALLSGEGKTFVRLGVNGKPLGLENPPYERFVNVKLQDYFENEGSFKTPIIWQKSKIGDETKDRVMYIFKPVTSLKKTIGMVVIGVDLESLFANVPNAISSVGGKLSIVSINCVFLISIIYYFAVGSKSRPSNSSVV